MVEAARGEYILNSAEIPISRAQNIENLSRSERDTLRKSDRVADIVDDLYQKQKGISFYPDGMTREELLEIGEANPAVLSPWTYVEKKNGDVVAVPFHEKFQRESRTAAQASRDAAKAADDPVTRRIFESLSVAFAKGEWSEFETAWLTEARPPNIDLFAGPFEPHMDKLLGRKHAFEIVVGYVDPIATDRRRKIVERALDVSGRTILPRVQVRVDHIYRVGGLLKGLGAQAFTMPNDPVVGERHGYKIVFFKESVEQTFRDHIFPVIQTIFEKELVRKYEPVDASFLEAEEIWLSLHEASHILVQHPSKKDRFLEYYAPVDELHCDVSALNLARELRDRGLIPPQLFEKILMVHVANKFVDYGRYYLLGVEEKEAYARGSVTELNYLFEHAKFTPNEHNKFGLWRESEIVEVSKDLLGWLDILARSGRYSDVRNQLLGRYNSRVLLKVFDSDIRQALTNSGEKESHSI